MREYVTWGVACCASLLVGTGLVTGAERGSRIKLTRVYERKLPSEFGFARAAFAADGVHLYLVHPDEPKLSLIDWKRGKEETVADFSHLPWVTLRTDHNPLSRLWVFPEGGYLLLGYSDALYVADASSLELIATLVDGQHQNAMGVAITAAADKLAVSVYDNESKKSEVWFFQVPYWHRPRRLPIDTHTGMAFSPDGRILAVQFSTVRGVDFDPRNQKSGIDLYDAQTGRFLRRMIAFTPIREGSPHTPFYFTKDGQNLVTTGVDYSRYPISVWDVGSGKLVRTIEDERPIRPLLAISPDGRWVAADVREHKPRWFRNQDYKIWDLGTGRVLYESPKYWALGAEGQIRSNHGCELDFSPDGNHLLEVCHGKNEKLMVYQLKLE
jgi:WD40 repeat protein